LECLTICSTIKIRILLIYWRKNLQVTLLRCFLSIFSDFSLSFFLGILILLDESCSLGSSSDEMFLSAITKNHSKNPLCSFPKRDRNAFCLSHTAKQVVYNVQGFREKNKDEVSNELQVCLS